MVRMKHHYTTSHSRGRAGGIVLCALLWAALAGLFATFAYLSNLFPYFSDDLIHLTRMGSSVDNAPEFWNIFKNIGWSYTNWVSRSGEFLLFFVLSALWYAPWMWGIWNALVAFLFIAAVFAHAFLRLPSLRKPKDMAVCLFLYAALFVLLAYPGETIFWRSGSVNYLWMFAIVLWFLYPVAKKFSGVFFTLPSGALGNNAAPAAWDVQSNAQKKLSQKFARKLGKKSGHKINLRAIAAAAGMLCVGLVAGMGNENNSPAIAAVLLLLVLVFVVRQALRGAHSNNMPLWVFAAIAGFLIGTLLLLAAPGVRVRSLNAAGGVSLANIFVLSNWADLFLRTFAYNMAPLVVFAAAMLFAAALFFARRGGMPYGARADIVRAAAYAFTGFLAVVAFLPAAKDAYPRTLFGASALLLIAALILCKIVLYAWLSPPRKIAAFVARVIAWVSMTAAFSCAMVLIFYALIPSYQYFNGVEARNVQILREARAAGASEAVIDTARGWGYGPAFSFAGRFSMAVYARDEATAGFNPSIALYHKVPSVRGALLSEVPQDVLRAAAFVGGFRRAGKALYRRFVPVQEQRIEPDVQQDAEPNSNADTQQPQK